MAGDGKRALAGAALTVFLAASSVGLVSGCSTSDQIADQLNKAQYVAQINALVKEMKDELRLGTALIQSGSLAEAKPRLEKAVTKFNRIVARLQAMNPPAAIKAVHERFTNALVHFRDVVASTKTALQQGNLGALLNGGQELLAFPQQLNSSIQEFQGQGYEVHE